MREIIESLAALISRMYVFNSDAYACQIKDNIVFYRTAYEKLDPVTIKYMIDKKLAFLTYQQNGDKLKWICFDFDINKDAIKACNKDEYDFFSDDIYRPKLIEDVLILTKFLSDKGINYSIEYSGNRGIHVWIFFDKAITKKMGYQIEQAILSSCHLNHSNKKGTGISIDLFPHNGMSRGNRIGKGVKLPLSFHKKSLLYSYVLNDINKINRISEIDEQFLKEQISLIGNIKRNSINSIIRLFGQEELNRHTELKAFEYKRLQLQASLNENEVIERLSKSIIYKNIFDKAPLFSEQDRLILVGTFIRMSTDDNAEYGRKMLIDIFKKTPNYNEELTLEKLDQLKDLYPPTIKYLERVYNTECEYCKNHSITNSIQLVGDNITQISTKSYFDYNWTKKAEQNYLMQNDECSLNFIYDNIEHLDIDDLNKDYAKIIKGIYYERPICYKYTRKEICVNGKQKTRELYSFSARDRVLSTYCIYRMNELLNNTNHEYSFGYRLNANSQFHNIFYNWNSLWMNYVSLIEKKIESKAYDNYFLIKFDISKFYDTLNHQYLLELLLRKANNLEETDGIALSEEKFSEYKNICNYLIDLCDNSCGDVGVPQGPAFARFLAELYLSSLDDEIIRLLDPDFESYYRYVDDMVLIVKSKKRADDLYRIIDEKFGTIYLNKNSEKSQIVKISEIRGSNFMGKNLDKYFIDSSENITMSIYLKQKIEGLLEKLLGDDELNVKELPFYLTHLIPEMIKVKRNAIINKMAVNDVGRGSLFKHFYKRIVFFDNCKFDFVMGLKGLSRANFISELNKMPLEYIKNMQPDIKQIVMQFCEKDDLKDYEKKEIARLIAIFAVDLDNKYIDFMIDELLELIVHTRNLRLSAVVIKRLCRKLAAIKDIDVFLSIFDKLLLNSLELKEKNIVINTISSKLKEFRDFAWIKNKEILFSIVCFTTYFNDFKLSKNIWEKLVCIDKSIIIDNRTNNFLKYNAHFGKGELSAGVVQFVIDSLRTGIKVNIGVTNVELLFISNLMLLLTGIQDKGNWKNYDELRKAILHYSEASNLEYFKWCISGAEHYPSSGWNYNNIVYNQRLLLFDKGRILLRGRKCIFSEFNIEPFQENVFFGEERMFYYIIDLTGKILLNFKQKLDEKRDMISALKFLLSEYESLKNASIICNLFEKGSYVETQDSKNFMFSKDDKCLVNDTFHVESHYDNLIKWMLDDFMHSTCDIRFNERIIYAKDFVNDFIPSSVKESADKILLVKKIIESINEYGVNTIYDLETCKINALIEYIKFKEKVTGESRIRYNEFEAIILYLELYKDEEKAKSSLLISKNDSFNSENLSTFSDSIKSSLSCNLNDLYVHKLEKVFKKIENNITGIDRSSSKLQDFINAQFDIIHADENNVVINDKEYALSSLKYIIWGEKEKEPTQVQQSDLIKLSSSVIFYNNGYIVIIPDWLQKIKDISIYKSNYYDICNFNNKSALENETYFEKAKHVVALQNDISEYAAKCRLFRYFHEIDIKYYSVLLHILASYKVITESEQDNFVAKIKKAYDECGNTNITMPLKNIEDDNGLIHILKNRKYESSFDRNKPYMNHIKNTEQSVRLHYEKAMQITIITDIGISGTQFTKALSFYLTKKNNEKKREYWCFEADVFSTLLKRIDKLVIICCYYTPTFEKTIIDFLDEQGYGNIEIIIDGEKIIENDFQFIECIGKVKLNTLKEYLRTRDDLLSKKTYDSDKTFHDYIKSLENPSTKSLLLTRYKSMPKAHLLNFTLDNLLNYRVDKKNK